MTYKRTTFDQSPTMLSLEKIAAEKGWLKHDEPIKKEAATKESSFLIDNLFVLCEKLRANGFHSYAKDLEGKFLLMKIAANKSYEINNETGKDVIENAHQDGSIKLDKKWSDDGIVETILDQHKKVLDVVKKMPKGKLSNKNIVNAVKIVLAENETKQELLHKLEIELMSFKKFLGEVWDIIASPEANLDLHVSSIFDSGGVRSESSPAGAMRVLNEFTNTDPENIIVDSIKKNMKVLVNLHQRIKPGTFGGMSEDSWNRVQPIFNDDLIPTIQRILKLRNNIQAFEREERRNKSHHNESQQSGVSPSTTNPAEDARKKALAPILALNQHVLDQYSKLMAQIAVIKNDKTLESDEIDARIKFINFNANALAQLSTGMQHLFPQLNENNIQSYIKRIQDQLKPIETKINQFYKAEGL